MTFLKTRLILMILLLASIPLIGCAPAVLGAAQVGGEENATWVFVETDDARGGNGIYRCRDDAGRVFCQRAKVQR